MHRLEVRWGDLAEARGFEFADLAPLGFAETFRDGHSSAGDRTFEFDDRKGRRLALASDSVPLVADLLCSEPSERRVHFCVPVFRYSRLPRRYYHHLGVASHLPAPADLRESDVAAVRLLEMAAIALAEVTPITVTLNHIGMWLDGFSPHLSTSRTTELMHTVSSLEPVGRASALSGQGAPPRLVPIVAAGPMGIAEAASALESIPVAEPLFTVLQELITVHDVLTWRADVRVDLGQFHAAEFHDGIAYSFAASNGLHLGDGGSVGAFAQRFLGGSSRLASAVVVPERVATLVAESGSDYNDVCDVAIAWDAGEVAPRVAVALASTLREQGLRVWEGQRRRRVKKEVESALGRGAAYFLYISDDDARRGMIAVRAQDGTIIDLAPSAVPAHLAGLTHQ